ncbi:MAG: S41 family peptidase [Thermaerobacter sp.]|nr:S41 family peptidase [Thermaerobacter sp.]
MKAWRIGAWIGITVMLMGASSAATWWVTASPSRAADARVPGGMLTSPQFKRFVSTYELIRSKSIWPTTANRLLLGATNGMVATLHDHFTDYLSRGQTESLKSQLDPSYVGVGIEVTLTRPPIIESVFLGSPAQKAGLRSGDVILAVDGHRTQSMSAAAALKMIRGPSGSPVRLRVTAGAGAGQRQVTLARRTIALPTVSSRMFPGHIAYLNIEEFGQETGAQSTAQFHQLMAQHPRGLVLDLRDNPGGEVSQALKVANLIVPKGPVVTLKYKNSRGDVTYDSTGPGTKLPIVVLVNHHTASAAEILAAAIQERQGGRLVGTRTYGKGIVQEVISLSGGASLKLTVARYYTPDGSYIEHVGLKPNLTVVEPVNIQPSDNPAQDPQLRAAMKMLDIMLRRRGRKS